MPLTLEQIMAVSYPAVQQEARRALPRQDLDFNGIDTSAENFWLLDPPSRKFKMKPWTLDGGLGLVRALQMDSRKYGYHLALGGGVLNSGRSDKDIDLYFLPLDNIREIKPNVIELEKWLTAMWGLPQDMGYNYPPLEEVPAGGLLSGTLSEAKVRPSFKSVYQRKLKFIRKDGDRIDVFIM